MFLLMKDGMWLMDYQPSGHREIIGDGTMVDVPMCIWCERSRDAIRIEDAAQATRIATIVGAVVMREKKER